MTTQRVFEIQYNGGDSAIFNSPKWGVQIPISIYELPTSHCIYNNFFKEKYNFEQYRGPTNTRKDNKVSYVLESKVQKSIENALTYFVKLWSDHNDPGVFKTLAYLGKGRIKTEHLNKILQIKNNNLYYWKDIQRYNLAKECIKYTSSNDEYKNIAFHLYVSTSTSWFGILGSNKNALKTAYNWPIMTSLAMYSNIRLNWDFITINHNLQLNTRREVITMLFILSQRENRHTGTFLNATDKEICKALQICGRRPYRKHYAIINALQWMYDYPETFNGNIVNLAKRSVEWHRDTTRQRSAAMLRYGLETKAAVPPIELPKQPEIKFLATAQDYLEESEQMGHCIASYLDAAIAGHCYCFHVEHEKTHATVEVSPFGRVNQSRGPYNQENKASIWGQRILSKWAKQLGTKEEVLC